MTEKILKSHTIVPDSLYVRREADRLLAEVIADMGRPGYVLVARQMGKTNLLLHAKRVLPISDDVFVYVDLTNSFTDARECFRHIIDVAIETYQDKFSYLYESIIENRKKENLLDHAEHTSEIRRLLRAIKGKIVIILDEIDALTNTNFSDTIFKQIRSVYFSRVNFPEMSRLTYVLSGVAEPSALIKDPSISPFNIGQSIFLGDFSYEEYSKFITLSGISASAEVVDRIFYWASGNPRITYDVCSRVESMIIDGTVPSTSDIDELVDTMYFSSLDRVPIDHIRELVENDKEIRSAVKGVKSGDNNLLKKSVRKKLYLAGILGSDFDSDYPKIKNKIIDTALSLSWLNELDKKSLIDFDTLKAFYKVERYVDIVTLSDENVAYLLEGKDSYYAENLLMIAFLRLHLYKSIINFYETNGYGLESEYSELPNFKKVKLENVFLCGLSYFSTDNIAKAIDCFKIVVSHELKDEFYYKSLIFIGSSMLAGDYDVNDTLNAFKAAIDEFSGDKHGLGASFIQEFRNVAYFGMARCQIQNGEIVGAKKSLETALRSSNISTRPTMLYYLASISEDERRREYLEEAIQIIAENQFKAYEFVIENPLYINYELLLAILEMCGENNYTQILDDIISYITDSDLSQKIQYAHLKGNDSELYLANSKTEIVAQIKVYCEIVKRSNSIGNKQAEVLFEFVYSIKDNNIPFEESLPLLVLLAKDERISSIKKADVVIIINHVSFAIRKNLAIESECLIRFLKKVYLPASETPSADKALFDYFEVDSLFKTKSPVAAFDKTKSLIIDLSSLDYDKVSKSLVNRSTFDIIKYNVAVNYVSMRSVFGGKPESKRAERVIAVYKTGEISVGKYKKFEADIKSGLCFIIQP